MSAMIGVPPGTGPGALSDRQTAARVAAGVAISLALHALLLFLYRQPAAAVAPTPANPPLSVRLRAAPPPLALPVPPPAPARKPAQPAIRPRARPAPAARPATPRRLVAVAPQPVAPAEPAFTVEVAPPLVAPPGEAPHFDLDAARKTARRVANAPDPARAGTALERLPPPPLQTESKFERAIKGAKRRDCKDGVPGGLLAPLFLAMDKKDSGCKW